MNSESATGYLPTLDGWRAIAILGVMIYHGSTTLFYPLGPYPSYEALKIIQVGHRGVDVFFSLSGFLICSRLIREYQNRGSIDLKGFYIRRFFRILPPFWLYIGTVAMLTVAGLIVVEDIEFVSSLLFFRNYVGPASGHGWYTGHIWSLSVEEHFYLGWPLVLLVLGLKRIGTLTFTAACLVPVWILTVRYFGWTAFGRGNATDARIDGLLWGCWAAILYTNPRIQPYLKKWAEPGVWIAIACALVLAVRYEPPFGHHIEAFLIPWLIVGTVQNPDWRISRLLEARPVRWIGRLSYSLYLWQQLWLFGRFTIARPFELGPFQELPLNLACTILCATASYYYVERPSIEFGRRLLSKMQKRGSQADSGPQSNSSSVHQKYDFKS